MNTRVTSLVVDHLAALLGQVFHFDGPADAVMSRYFKQHPNLGQRDRGLIAEATFHALRRFATLGWILQPAHASRAPRLAALVTLARQHGLASLDARALRGDERAVRGALGIEIANAPSSIRAEVPHWLFQRVTAQYHDAEPLLAALAEAAPLDLRVNLLKADRARVLAELATAARDRAGVEAIATPWSPEGIRLSEKQAITRWPVYQDGRVEVQDEGSQLIGLLVAPKRSEMVVDFCAGAGGKTLALGALMRSHGPVVRVRRSAHAARRARAARWRAAGFRTCIRPPSPASATPRVKRLARQARPRAG